MSISIKAFIENNRKEIETIYDESMYERIIKVFEIRNRYLMRKYIKTLIDEIKENKNSKIRCIHYTLSKLYMVLRVDEKRRMERIEILYKRKENEKMYETIKESQMLSIKEYMTYILLTPYDINPVKKNDSYLIYKINTDDIERMEYKSEYNRKSMESIIERMREMLKE